MSSITHLTVPEFETARASPISSASAGEGGITPRVYSINKITTINGPISVPESPRRPNPRAPRRSNLRDPKVAYSRTPPRRPNSGFFVTAVGSPLRPHMTSHSPTYMDVPALMRSRSSTVIGLSTTDQTIGRPPTSRLRSPTIRRPISSYSPATGSSERPPVALRSTTSIEVAGSRLIDATRIQSPTSHLPEANGSVTATVPLERPQEPIISPASQRSAISRSANSMIRASALTSPMATLGRSTGAMTRSPQCFPVAKSQKSVRFQITNTSMHHQPSMNSPQIPTHEPSTLTRGSQTFTQYFYTPTRQATTLSTLPLHSTRPHRGPPNHPLVPTRPRALTKSQAVAHAQEIMAARQDSTTHSPTHPLPFGVGLTHHEVARQAEAERVRIQEFAARKTAENNPPQSPKGIRRETIAFIRAATNRRLDAQEYAARMAKETEAKRTMQQKAERMMQNIRRVEADVYGTAPQMAEPNKEMIEAAQILMQLQQANIANLQSMIQMAEQQVAQQQAAARQAAEFQAAQHRAAGIRAAQRQAASEADSAATRLLYARHGWDLQFEEQRRERERAREEMERRLNEEWARRNSSTGRLLLLDGEVSDSLTIFLGQFSGGFSGEFLGGFSGGH